jgi:hypothetical protein
VQFDATLKLFAPVTVAEKAPLIAGENVPPLIPEIVTVLPVDNPWGIEVVIVQGLPTLIAEIDGRLQLEGTVNRVVSTNVTGKLPFIPGVDAPDATPEIATRSPVANP